MKRKRDVSTPRTDHQCPLHHLDLSGKIDRFLLWMIDLMSLGGGRIICMIYDIFLGLDLYCTDPTQRITPPGYDLDYTDRDEREGQR